MNPWGLLIVGIGIIIIILGVTGGQTRILEAFKGK